MGNPLIRMNSVRAPANVYKAGGGAKMPGQMVQNALGGAHFAKPEFLQQGHNTNGTMKTGKGKRRKGAAPGQRNYHG